MALLFLRRDLSYLMFVMSVIMTSEIKNKKMSTPQVVEVPAVGFLKSLLHPAPPRAMTVHGKSAPFRA